MSAYTPSTATVRECFLDGAAGEFIGADFDRFLAAHDRETAARAWDEAVRAMRYEDGTPVELVANVNPYREGGADRD